MSQSPATPRHPRHASTATADIPQAQPHDNRQAKSSDPAAAFLNGPHHRDHMEPGALNLGGPPLSQGMGNLADELADAFSDSDLDEEGGDVENGQPQLSDFGPRRELDGSTKGAARDGPADTWTPRKSQTEDKAKAQQLLSPHARQNRSRAADYDGSEYGSESDLDCPGIPATLVAKMDGIEYLARRGTENYGGAGDDVFKRVTEGLRDLGSQLIVEGNASRLITAHTALATHLVHQTRQLHGLTFPLLSPLVPAPDEETIRDLIPLLVSLSAHMPRPSTFAFSSITALHTITSDLIQTLSYLSDTLQMSRQTTAMATRRLKNARELVSEIRRDEELREEGDKWLNRGNWSQRLARRECASVCGEVIDGFESFCNDWRRRLLAQADL